MRFKFLFLLCLALFPLGVKAECDYQRKADLQKIASNVQINSSYRLNENRVPIFTIELSNITPDIYVVDNYGNTITPDSNKVFEVYSGTSMTYNIYSADINCHGYSITTKYVKLQPYNKFYNSDECKEYPEFKYCSLWYNADFSYNYLKKKLLEYKNSKDVVQPVQTDKQASVLLYVIVGFGLFISVIVAIIYLRRKKYGM